MVRSYPTKDYEHEEVAQLNIKPWQLNMLKANPPYTSWGNGEDYMEENNENGHGWDKAKSYKNWAEFLANWSMGLDDLNECVNFYFFLHRANHQCPACEGSGQNPETKKIAEAFYNHDGRGIRWDDKITQDEVIELVKHRRLTDFVKPTTTLDGKTEVRNYFFDEEKGCWMGFIRTKGIKGKLVKVKEPTEYPTAEEINKAQHERGMGFRSHDAINRWILIETRAKRLGVYGKCEHCGGNGYIFDEPEGKLGLQLWMLHPRKGCSRGVLINEVTKEDLKQVKKYLAKAAQRNAMRFQAFVPEHKTK